MKLAGAFGLLLLMAVGFISSCSTPPKAQRELAAPQQKFEKLGAAGERNSWPEYRLGLGDMIEVKFSTTTASNDL